MVDIPLVTLNNGVKMPQLGFGTWKLADGDEVEEAILAALEAGYRAIDTAAIYGNEAGVGRAIQKAGMKREEVFITTKLWNSDQGYASAKQAFRESLEKLQVKYVDLYLIHWPQGQRSQEAWRALEELYEAGLTRAIGVSNFSPADLDQLLASAKTIPAVNQIELHPKLTQQETREYCKKKNICIESWSPLMKGGTSLQHEILLTLSKKYGKSPAQVVLRWHIQNGFIVIPKSATPERIRENIAIFDFELSDEDMAKITALDTHSASLKANSW